MFWKGPSSPLGVVQLSILVGVVSLSLGVMVGRYRVFPYQVLAAVKQVVAPAELEVPGVIPTDPEYVDRRALFATVDTQVDLVVVGDSIVAGGDWEGLSDGIRIANRGIPSDTVAGVRARLGDVLRLRPAGVFIMIGVNDFLANRSLGDVRDDYLSILRTLRAERISVVVQATLLVGTENPYFYELNGKIRQLNDALRAASRAEGFTFFDTNESLAPNGVLHSGFTNDGVHLNHRGYAAWVVALRENARKTEGQGFAVITSKKNTASLVNGRLIGS